MDKVTITLASPPWEEDLVAEIEYAGVFWSILKWEEDVLYLQTISETGEPIAQIPLDVALQALDNASKRIARGEGFTLNLPKEAQ